MSSAPRAAVGRVAAAGLRRRWRGLVVLGLLLGLAGGLSIAAVAGARRTETAYPRFLEETVAADAVVFASQEGIYNPDFEPLRQLPYVTASGAFSIVFVPEPVCLFAASDDWLTRVDRPHVVEGRLPDPARPHEAFLASGDASPPGSSVRVGDTVPVHVVPSLEGLGAPADPAEAIEVELEVVGVGKSSFEIATIPSLKGCLFVGAGFLDRYDLHEQVFHNLMVRLENGQADVRQLERDATRLLGVPVPVQDLAGNTKRVTNGTDLERSGLYLFAAAVAVAGALIVGQALARSVRGGSDVAGVLRAIGFARPALVVALGLPYVLAAAVAVATAVATAVALSPRFPIGLARSVEPDPGLAIDALAIGLGAAALLTFVVAIVVSVAVVATRPFATGAVARSSRSFTVVSNLGASIAASLGVGLALEAGRGRRALPSRPAQLAAIVGVLGVVGAFTLGSGIDDAIEHKERFGTVWDLDLLDYSGENGPAYQAAIEALEADPSVDATATITKQNLPFGDGSLPTFAVEPSTGAIEFTVLHGHRPLQRGEVVLGPASAAGAGLGIGDRMRLGADQREMEVVGLGLLPETAHSQFDQGAWITAEQGAALFSAPPDPAVTVYTVARLRAGHEPEAVIERMGSVLTPDLDLYPPDPSADQQNLKGLRLLPVLFAVFTILLAVGALAHVAVSVLRRRRGELAVLRAIGVTPGQVWRSLLWQATCLGVVGVVIGIPVGIGVGRGAWRSVADATPMVYVAPLAAVAVLLVVPLTVVLANLVAMLPGWRAARLRPAEVLRTE